MRILFQLPYPGYLRMYSSTIEALAERGHTVLLAYDKPAKRRDEAAAGIEARAGVEVVEPLPPAARRFEEAIEKLRLTTDYVRYLDRPFSDSTYHRRRLEPNLPSALAFLKRLPADLVVAAPALRGLLALERLVPSDREVERAIDAHRPDAVVVTPLIGRSRAGIRQTDTVKSARALGVPVGLAVASWDHLTTKGVVKALPDRVFVWNEIQRSEAVELHGVPFERVVVTGAQLFDRWFERGPSRTRAEFLTPLGLEASAPYVLYVGSSPSIAPAAKEVSFVRRWLAALRASAEPSLRELGVLVRPHPGNVDEWARVDLEDERGAVTPRTRPGLPMSDDDEALYYDSIHFASAVVGINTSAMVESFVQRRPVLTLRTPAFRETQDGTLHFRHLERASAGALQSASGLAEHLEQLETTVQSPAERREPIESFLRAFVRPHGLERPATPILAQAIEDLATRDRVLEPLGVGLAQRGQVSA